MAERTTIDFLATFGQEQEPTFGEMLLVETKKSDG
jgi:hypothetical protein